MVDELLVRVFTEWLVLVDGGAPELAGGRDIGGFWDKGLLVAASDRCEGEGVPVVFSLSFGWKLGELG